MIDKEKIKKEMLSTKTLEEFNKNIRKITSQLYNDKEIREHANMLAREIGIPLGTQPKDSTIIVDYFE